MKNKFIKKTVKHSKNNSTSVKLDGTEQEGRIIAHFGAVAEVENSQGEVIRCHLRKNQEPVITGDHVLWHPEKDNTGIVVTGLPRKSLLSRPENSHRNKLIAANIDTIVIVTAPPPNFSEHLLDRYLVAAERVGVQAVILLNKVDLLNEDELVAMQACLSTYEKMGYPVIYSSIFTKNGLHELETILQDKTSVLVGVSGVGKSSIISALTGNQSIKIGEVAESKQGKHTTTATRLYHLEQGGALIDSPGVREFSLWHMSKEEVIEGFVEFKPYLGSCKFRNCQHQTEPGCALQLAVADNKISARRWKSYLEIIDEEQD